MANACLQIFEIIAAVTSCKESCLYENTQVAFLEEPDSERPLRNGRFGFVIALGRGPSGDRPQPGGASGLVSAVLKALSQESAGEGKKNSQGKVKIGKGFKMFSDRERGCWNGSGEERTFRASRTELGAAMIRVRGSRKAGSPLLSVVLALTAERFLRLGSPVRRNARTNH